MDSKKPRILFLYNDYRQDLYGEAGGCGWYRIVGPAEEIKKARPDWSVVIAHNPPTGSSWNDFLKDFDLIVVHHPDSPDFVGLLMGIRDALDKRVVVDLDDNYMQVDESNPASKVYYAGSPFVRTTVKAAQWADAVTVSTDHLGVVYGSFMDKKPVTLPNAIDPAQWELRAPNDTGKIILGYAGSPTHLEDLMMIKPVLEEILLEHPEVELDFMNYCPHQFLDAFPGRISVYKGETSYVKFTKKLPWMKFDIGLAPLKDTEFNRAKSSCKWMEYSMIWIPTAASNVGPYAREIKHGKTGLLASTLKEWKENLELLINDEKERKRLAKNARSFVLRRLSQSATITPRIQLYESLLSR